MNREKQTWLLRMDDVGASTKINEQYAAIHWRLSKYHLPTPRFLQWGPLKRVEWWRGWGPYGELSVEIWEDLVRLLHQNNAKLTVGVTATWAVSAKELILFAQRFPGQTKVIKEAVQAGVIEVANHGLTHCVLRDDMFLPQRWHGNRKYHREFWGWVDQEILRERIKRSQELLCKMLAVDVKTFIPPGNVLAEGLEEVLYECGIRYVSSTPTVLAKIKGGKILTVEAARVIDFHDRDIALKGTSWLQKLLAEKNGVFGTITEFMEERLK